MELPQNVHFVNYNEIDPNGYYSLKPGETLIFPWIHFDTTEISLVNTMENSQDFSIQAWLSRKPLDGVLFPFISYMNYIQVPSNGRSITITSKKGDDLFLESGDYFLNVKNMDNEANSFRVLFSLNGQSTNPVIPSETVSELNHDTSVGTQTSYGLVVAQVDDGLTILDTTLNGEDTYSLMDGTSLIASVKLFDSTVLKGSKQVKSSYIDESNGRSQDLHLMFEFLKSKYGLILGQLYDLSNNKHFWDILSRYPGKVKLNTWNRNTGERIVLNGDNLSCESLWERDPNIFLFIQ